VFPVGIGLRDPRSQKRDLGHPSISPFDIAEDTSFVISLPTRFSEAVARDDKGKGVGSIESGCWTEAFFISLGGPEAHDFSGRDDKFVEPSTGPLFMGTQHIFLQQICHLDRSVPGFPATQRRTWPRVRLSLRKAA
jgi:hypothetical protein